MGAADHGQFILSGELIHGSTDSREAGAAEVVANQQTVCPELWPACGDVGLGCFEDFDSACKDDRHRRQFSWALLLVRGTLEGALSCDSQATDTAITPRFCIV